GRAARAEARYHVPVLRIDRFDQRALENAYVVHPQEVPMIIEIDHDRLEKMSRERLALRGPRTLKNIVMLRVHVDDIEEIVLLVEGHARERAFSGHDRN